jgi:hypothetical protein
VRYDSTWAVGSRPADGGSSIEALSLARCSPSALAGDVQLGQAQTTDVGLPLAAIIASTTA